MNDLALSIKVRVDADQAKVSLDQTRQSVEAVGRSAEEQNRKLTGAVRQMAEAQGAAAAAQDRVRRSAEALSAAAAHGGASMVRGAEQAAAAARLSRQQMLALQYTVNDVAASLASGASPFTILMQQGGQVTQAFGGVQGSALALRGALFSVAGAAASAAGAVGALVLANENYSASVRQVLIANRVMGGAIGLTSAELEKLAVESAKAGEVSIRAARAQQAMYLSTGKIGGEVMRQLIMLSRDYAVAMGVELPEAARELAVTFADPERGAKRLQDQLGLLDHSSMSLIRTLALQGERTRAQEVLAGALERRIKGLSEQTSWYARAWESVGRAAENAWDAIGRATAPETNAEAIARLERRRDRLSGARRPEDEEDRPTGSVTASLARQNPRFAAPPTGPGELASISSELARRYAQRDLEAQAARQDSLAREKERQEADMHAFVLRHDPLARRRKELDDEITQGQRIVSERTAAVDIDESAMDSIAPETKAAIERLFS